MTKKYDEDGYDMYGFDRKGYNKLGFDKNNIHKDTHDIYDFDGFDFEGYNSKGFDKFGFNKFGIHHITNTKFDCDGFDKLGFNKEGFKRNGINKYTLTKYDLSGYDINGFDKHGKSKNNKKVSSTKLKISSENKENSFTKKTKFTSQKNYDFNFQTPINKKNIIFALDDEEQINKKFCEYSVKTINFEEMGLYSLILTEKIGEPHHFSRKIQIDEVMEGGKIWWEVDKIPSYAEIFLVFPDEEKIVFRFLKGKPPKIGTNIRIYLPNYIEPLKNCWENNMYVHLINRWLTDIENYKFEDSDFNIEGPYKTWLRTNQKKAFNLLKMKAGLL